MRKWLFLLLVLAILYALSKITRKQHRSRYPVIRRIDRAITLLVWVLLTAYVVSFFYWLFTEIIR
jgi:MFS superfamily sulfate permease-like transporter